MNYKDKGSLLKKPPVSLLLCGLCDHSPPDHCEQKPSSLALLFMLAPPTWHPIQFLVPCWPALLCQALELYPVWCPGRPGTSSFSERWFTHLGQRILSLPRAKGVKLSATSWLMREREMSSQISTSCHSLRKKAQGSSPFLSLLFFQPQDKAGLLWSTSAFQRC